MASNNTIKVTDLDFDTIKTNLTGYMSSQAEFKDYDFEASSMQIILNLLAYNTYYNSFYLNMVGNEMFLDSATQRHNVVSRAKMLGYIPSSYEGAAATITLKVVPTGSPAYISVAKNTQFVTSVSGKSYTFVNPSAEIIVPDDSGIYQKQISIIEGKPLTFAYTVSTLNPDRYIIPNDRADSRSVEVNVVESTSNTSYTVYTRATNLTAVTGSTAAFFLQESETGKTEILFGDGIIGRSLKNGNIVNISYRTCNGTDANKVSSFTASGPIDGYSAITITTVASAVGGANTETIESIKYNAPRVFESQNRAVTKEDYKRLVLGNFSDVQSINVWGGEDNDPPTYGKVFISCKPTGGALLSVTRKAEITDYLSSRKVLAIETEIVDATYLYLEPEISIRYNSTLTTLTSAQIINKLQTSIINYETNDLGRFGNRFIYSQFIEKLSNVSDSIVSVSAKGRVQKRFTPTAGVSSTYTIPFNMALQSITSGITLTITPGEHPGRGLTVSSSAFTYGGYTCYLDDDGFGYVRIYYLDATSRRIYLHYSAGTVDYNTGLVRLNNVIIQSGTEIQVSVVPRVHNIDTIRNQLLLIAGATIKLYDDLSGALVGAATSVNTEGGTSSIIESGVINVIY